MRSVSRLVASFDHLVIAATDLEAGARYVKQVLGVDIPFGGEHKQMGTHNHLMSLGNNCFLEVLAINPTAPGPNRPRWYALDDPSLRSRIQKQPQLIGWVINTNHIKALLDQTKFNFGQVELINRGSLNWYFSLPTDGSLLASGFLPYIIQWNAELHPATSMAELGCELKKVNIYHPQANWLRSVLTEINADQLVNVRNTSANQTAYMVAVINTPGGLKELVLKL